MEKGNENKINGTLSIEDAGLQNLEMSRTIPVVNVRVEDIKDVMARIWDPFWDQIDLDDNTPIILEKRENTILAGQYRLYKAKLAGEKEIRAVYIDSLKDITLRSILEEFGNKKLSYSFAYSLYASTAMKEELISFSDFCNQIYYIFMNIDFKARIAECIDFLNYAMGEPNNAR